MTEASPDLTGMPAADGRTRSASLQMARGIAALAVTLFHIGYYSQAVFGDSRLCDVFSRGGIYGVTAFFCISGYLMAGLCRTQEPVQFILNRIARIYPTYFLVVGLFLAAHLAFSAPPQSVLEMGWKRFFKSVSLLPLGEMYRPLAVEWTLVYEVSFYILMSVFCLRPLRPLLLPFLWLWGAATVAAYVWGIGASPMQPKPHEVPLSIWNLGFICGALVPSIERRPFFASKAAFLGFILFLTSEAFGTTGRAVQLPVAFALLLGSLRHREVAAQSSGESWLGKSLIRLGDWSYALYLCHVPVATIVLSQLHRRQQGSLLATATVSLGCVLLIAALLGICDIRLHAWGKDVARRLLARRGWARSAGAAVYTAAFAMMLLCSARALPRSSPPALPDAAGVPPAAAEFKPGTLQTDILAGLHARGLREQADAVQGSIDSLLRDPDGYRLTGWALDRKAGSEPVRILLFESDRLLGAIVASGPRQDVAGALLLDPRSFNDISFVLSVPGPVPKDPRFAAIAVGPSGYRTLVPTSGLLSLPESKPGRLKGR